MLSKRLNTMVLEYREMLQEHVLTPGNASRLVAAATIAEALDDINATLTRDKYNLDDEALPRG